MNPLKQFIQKIITDLKLGDLTPSLKKTLEFRIEKIVDKQIEDAVNRSFTTDDWDTFNGYLKTHPEATEADAYKVVIDKHPEMQGTFEDAFKESYNQVMMMGAATDIAMMQTSDKKDEA